MYMARVITFGCSNTFGEGLDNPKEQAWGFYVGKQLNRKFINQGALGASNKLICHKVYSFDFYQDDIVIILWTFIERSCVLFNRERHLDFIPQGNNEVCIQYYKDYFSEYDSQFTSFVFMNRTIDYLTQKGIKVYFIFNNINYISHIENKTGYLPILFSDYYDEYPRAKDGLHMGAEGNKVFANNVYKFIAEKTLI